MRRAWPHAGELARCASIRRRQASTYRLDTRNQGVRDATWRNRPVVPLRESLARLRMTIFIFAKKTCYGRGAVAVIGVDDISWRR